MSADSLSEDILRCTDQAATNASDVSDIAKLDGTALIGDIFTLVAAICKVEPNVREKNWIRSLTFRRYSPPH